MSREREIKEVIRKIAQSGEKDSLFIVAEVKEVQEDTCSVIYNGLELSDVRLNAIANGNKNNLLIKPKQGSKVLVGDMSGGELRDLVVLQYSEIETITINGGELGGLIKIQELTDKINELVDVFNKHTHDVATTGSAAAQKGTAAATLTAAKKLNKTDFEDDKIRH